MSLKSRLVLVDAAALAVAWVGGLWLCALFGLADATAPAALALAAAGLVCGLGLLAARRLWRTRVCAVRSAELAAVGQVAIASGLLVAGLWSLAGQPVAPSAVAVSAVLSALLLAAGRVGFRSWLHSARRAGRHVRQVVVVGIDHEALDLLDVLGDHPETGYAVCGVVGDPDAIDLLPSGIPWLGEVQDAAQAVADTCASGALVVGSALTADELNTTVRRLLADGTHVHLSSGLHGISHARLRALPLAHEPLLYVEQLRITRSQLAAKRLLDVTLTVALGVAALPMLLVAALTIKLEDGGPVLFRQVRVGQHGRRFRLYKLRTMVPDAESRLSEVLALNQRSGPLFKTAADPRVTRVGRLLRATSIDELPQLLNVLRGEMSLVGPRPALPAETERFDPALRGRVRMPPGMTGLWQVEARDSSSFTSYRRLDLFYVENWSVGLDLSILLGTASVVLRRAFGARGEGELDEAPAAAASRAAEVRELAAQASAGQAGASRPWPQHGDV